jgi:hypothetical protein
MNVEIKLPPLVKRQYAKAISQHDPRKLGPGLVVLWEDHRRAADPNFDLVRSIRLQWTLKEDAVGNRHYEVAPLSPADLAAVDDLEVELRKWAL